MLSMAPAPRIGQLKALCSKGTTVSYSRILRHLLLMLLIGLYLLVFLLSNLWSDIPLRCLVAAVKTQFLMGDAFQCSLLYQQGREGHLQGIIQSCP